MFFFFPFLPPSLSIDAAKTAKVGLAAPNPLVYKVPNGEETHLFGFNCHKTYLIHHHH